MKTIKLFLLGASIVALTGCSNGGGETSSSSESTSTSTGPTLTEFDLPSKFLTSYQTEKFGNYIYEYDAANKTLKGNYFTNFAGFPDTFDASKSFTSQVEYEFDYNHKNNTVMTAVGYGGASLKFGYKDDFLKMNDTADVMAFDDCETRYAKSFAGSYIGDDKVTVSTYDGNGSWSDEKKYIRVDISGNTISVYTSNTKSSWVPFALDQEITYVTCFGVYAKKRAFTLRGFNVTDNIFKFSKGTAADDDITISTVTMCQAE